MLFNQRGRIAYDSRIEYGLRAGIKRRDRHAPCALAADAPVGTRLDGALDAVLAPVGHPLHTVDGVQRLLAEIVVVDVDEPLVHAAENHRRFAAPTVRVAVRVILLMHQRGLIAQQFQHGLVGLALAVLFEDGFAEQVSGHLLCQR